MKFYGYEIDFYDVESTGVSIEYVLLNACLTLDESRFCKRKWKKFSIKHPNFNLQSQKSLHKLLDRIGEAVDKAHIELSNGNIGSAKDLLVEYNELGVGVYRVADAEEPMKRVSEYQSYNTKAGAYDCSYIAHSSIYLCIWIDW